MGRGDSSENCCLPFSPSGDAEENGVPATSSRQAQPESPRRLKSYELFLLLFISNPFNIQESTVRRGLIRTKGGCFQLPVVECPLRQKWPFPFLSSTEIKYQKVFLLLFIKIKIIALFIYRRKENDEQFPTTKLLDSNSHHGN